MVRLISLLVMMLNLMGASETVRLRSRPSELSKEDVREMVAKHNFFSKNALYDRDLSHPDGDFPNQFEIGKIQDKRVVIDKRTGLMWQAGGSEDLMSLEAALQWIEALNAEIWAGFSDWRLPTLEEAASLLEKRPNDAGFYIDRRFHVIQFVIWTADAAPLFKQWVVHLEDGSIYGFLRKVNESYARAVRSIKFL